MKFNKVYIEITNICGLSCSFCPTKILPSTTMDLQVFENILVQLKPYTKEITYHIFGDPLTLSNLKQYLDLSLKHNFKVHITTTGYYLNKFDLNLFLHPCIKQINFSLNSFNKNNIDKTLNEYLDPMFKLSSLKLDNNINSFLNFRLWNLDVNNKEELFNSEIINKLETNYNINLSNIEYKKPTRLANKIKLNFDNYFQWPTLKSNHYSHGTCYGLKSHFGILSSGVVVPCCLDSNGVVNLGNIKNKSLKEILTSTKSINIINGFKHNIATEELCKKCQYKDKFKKI
ncbi:Molybdenum cofactor biosynthesis enzyme and related Fe-S oxidoreductases [hydrothermal vent metagenome]|uniref:Molybdenum cofactor biosynthesis enzyme and related Fe-S oxidoreductases n=1 Tax=hydrothermal vent metagenome TaxID=652676 RepID=A0A3B1E5H7_9ZZZZ